MQNDNKNTLMFIVSAFAILIGYQFFILGPQQKQAEAQLTFRRSELSRTERLSAQGTVSESARDKARLEVETAAAALDSARASVAPV